MIRPYALMEAVGMASVRFGWAWCDPWVVLRKLKAWWRTLRTFPQVSTWIVIRSISITCRLVCEWFSSLPKKSGAIHFEQLDQIAKTQAPSLDLTPRVLVAVFNAQRDVKQRDDKGHITFVAGTDRQNVHAQFEGQAEVPGEVKGGFDES